MGLILCEETYVTNNDPLPDIEEGSSLFDRVGECEEAVEAMCIAFHFLDLLDLRAEEGGEGVKGSENNQFATE
jgi:hypothetical protein